MPDCWTDWRGDAAGGFKCYGLGHGPVVDMHTFIREIILGVTALVSKTCQETVSETDRFHGQKQREYHAQLIYSYHTV